MQRGLARRAVCLAFLMASSTNAHALNPALHVNQYGHTTWTIREGIIKTSVFAIAQTPDGYLWLGTESGLLRFDGVRTMAWRPPVGEQLPDERINALLGSRDGRLWIGTARGLASWKDGTLVSYPELGGQQIASLAEDRDGTVWAGSANVPYARLCAIGAAVQCFGQDGRLGNAVLSLLPEGAALWVGAVTGLWQWKAPEPARFAMPTRNLNALLRINEGPLLISTPDGIIQLVGNEIQSYAARGVGRLTGAYRLLRDRDGGLWVGTLGRGLVHMPQERSDLFTQSDGLSGNSINALYEDREGDVWVATNGGLDRFREVAVTAFSTKQGLSDQRASSVLAARDRSVWIGTADGLNRWKDGRMTVYRTRDGLPHDTVGTLFEDSTGRIVASTLRGLAAFADGKFVPFSSV